MILNVLKTIMQDPNVANQVDLILKLDQDRAWLLENLDRGKWPEIRTELAELETFDRPISAVPCKIWRCRFDKSTLSSSITPMVPTPAAAR